MADDPRVEEPATLEPEGGELAEWADALEANAQDMRDGFEASEPDIRNAASAIRAHRCQPDDPAPWAVAERERNDGQIALIRIARAAETSINWYAPDPAGQVADAVRRLAAAPPPSAATADQLDAATTERAWPAEARRQSIARAIETGEQLVWPDGSIATVIDRLAAPLPAGDGFAWARAQLASPHAPSAATASSDDEEEDIQRALRAADSGSAMHWPTVASVLADEVRRIRGPRPSPPPADSGVEGVDRDALVRAFMVAERVHSDRWRYLPERADRAEAEAMADVALAEIERQRGER